MASDTRASYTEQAFDGQVVTDWAALDNVCNVDMPCHDEPRPASLVGEHYAESVMDAMRRLQAGEDDDYPWRYGVVPGGPYA